MCRLAVLCALLGLLGAGPVSAKPVDNYLRLIAAFPVDDAGTLREFAALPKEEITAAILECLTAADARRAPQADAQRIVTAVVFACQPQVLLGAAMLHAVTATLLMPSDPGLAEFHIDSGARILSIFLTKDDLRRNSSVRLLQFSRLNGDLKVANLAGHESAFVQRWYAYVIRLELSFGRWNSGQTLLLRISASSERSPEVDVARGLLAEMPVLKGYPDIREGVESLRNPDNNISDRVRQQLQSATLWYRGYPPYAEARLRLVWAHLLLGDPRAWDEAAPLTAPNARTEDRYLAHLFRGGVAEQRRTPADAVAEYERAYAAAPHYRTGCIALSHALKMAGDLPRARGIAAACLAIEEDDRHPDPWWAFRSGSLDVPTTEWLQEAAWP